MPVSARHSRPDTPDGRLLELIEAKKAHVRAQVEHPFRVIKQQFDLQLIRLRCLGKNQCKVNGSTRCRICVWPGGSCSRQSELANGVSEFLT